MLARGWDEIRGFWKNLQTMQQRIEIRAFRETDRGSLVEVPPVDVGSWT